MKGFHADKITGGAKHFRTRTFWRGSFPVERRGPDLFQVPKLERKNVLITPHQWSEHWAKEQQIAEASRALWNDIVQVEKRQLEEAECEAKVWASGMFEINAEEEWARRNFETEQLLAREKEERERLSKEDIEKEKSVAMQRAADEASRAWELKIHAARHEYNILQGVFLQKEYRRIAKRTRCGKSGKRACKQWRVRVYPGETRESVLGSVIAFG